MAPQPATITQKDLQAAIAAMKEANLDVPLQFTNFRD
ncbi:MAG: hypothetical protein B7X07_02195 [Actinobacteria bacterium 21-64-8]|nr:MAG: hypothetical protein B7X07_02195 [Actinobacteria bacterium 21-64-8]